MISTVVTCDFCGNEIIGEYRKLRQEFTNKDEAGGYNDMCMNCLNAVISHRRLPVKTAKDFTDAALQ